MYIWAHFKTITYHKYLVLKGCFQVGLFRQGLLHDMSKYMPSEFLVGAKYYQGDRSPNNAEREATGYSSSWMHHKGRNKHHYEYWTDYNIKNPQQLVSCVPMPMCYIIEMFMDRIAACKVYKKDQYTDASPLEYYLKSVEKASEMLHQDTRKELERLLFMLAKKGEKKTFSYIRCRLKKQNRKNSIL